MPAEAGGHPFPRAVRGSGSGVGFAFAGLVNAFREGRYSLDTLVERVLC